jgi:hypothetical protein
MSSDPDRRQAGDRFSGQRRAVWVIPTTNWDGLRRLDELVQRTVEQGQSCQDGQSDLCVTRVTHVQHVTH